MFVDLSDPLQSTLGFSRLSSQGVESKNLNVHELGDLPYLILEMDSSFARVMHDSFRFATTQNSQLCWQEKCKEQDPQILMKSISFNLHKVLRYVYHFRPWTLRTYHFMHHRVGEGVAKWIEYWLTITSSLAGISLCFNIRIFVFFFSEPQGKITYII